MTHGPCGQPFGEGLRTDRAWRIHRETCQACKAMQQVKDAYHEQHKDAKGRSDVHELLWWVELLPLPD